MGFVCQGRYALAPIEPTDAEKYVNLQLDCMEQTYDPIYFDTLGESFTARHRAERNEYLEDFHRHLSSPTVRGFFAYDVPGWTPDGGLSCSIGARIDWDKPVGVALSLCEPSSWELERADTLSELPAGTRKLTHLYTLDHTHGTGLGRALYDSVIYPTKTPTCGSWLKTNERSPSTSASATVTKACTSKHAASGDPDAAYDTRASSTPKRHTTPGGDTHPTLPQQQPRTRPHDAAHRTPC